jgi:hypothetical protein
VIELAMEDSDASVVLKHMFSRRFKAGASDKGAVRKSVIETIVFTVTESTEFDDKLLNTMGCTLPHRLLTECEYKASPRVPIPIKTKATMVNVRSKAGTNRVGFAILSCKENVSTGTPKEKDNTPNVRNNSTGDPIVYRDWKFSSCVRNPS